VVHKPEGYDISKDLYPVVYLLDGDTNLLHTAGIIDYLQRSQLMPKIIFIAINNIDRIRDFTPTPSEETKKTIITTNGRSR
jgi:predicted alpha/beta superfamily hydrolase